MDSPKASPRGLSNPTEKHAPIIPAAPNASTEAKAEPKSETPLPSSVVEEDAFHPNLWFLNAGMHTITQVRTILQKIMQEASLSEDTLGPIRLIPLRNGSKQHLYRVVMLPQLASAITESSLGSAFLKQTPSYYLPIPSQMHGQPEDLTHTLSVFKIPAHASPERIKYMMECEIAALRRFGFVAPKRVTEFTVERDLIELRFACFDAKERVTPREVAWSRLVLHGLDLQPYLDAPEPLKIRLHYSNQMNADQLLPCRWKRCYLRVEEKQSRAGPQERTHPSVPPLAFPPAPLPSPMPDPTIQWVYAPHQCPNCGFHLVPHWLPPPYPPAYYPPSPGPGPGPVPVPVPFSRMRMRSEQLRPTSS